MGRRLTAAERAERLAVWNAGKLAQKSYARMAAELGLDPDVFRTWCLEQQKPRGTVSKVQAKRVARACMCCERSFQSDGPHNRLCRDCGTRSVSPYTPGGAGDSGRHVWARRS